MIVLNFMNFIGLSFLKLLIVTLLFIAMGFSLAFMIAMEQLTYALEYINSYVD
jgi:ammonia channel protein AmtB